MFNTPEKLSRASCGGDVSSRLLRLPRIPATSFGSNVSEGLAMDHLGPLVLLPPPPPNRLDAASPEVGDEKALRRSLLPGLFKSSSSENSAMTLCGASDW